jgi:hypothetical protein
MTLLKILTLNMKYSKNKFINRDNHNLTNQIYKIELTSINIILKPSPKSIKLSTIRFSLLNHLSFIPISSIVLELEYK